MINCKAGDLAVVVDLDAGKAEFQENEYALEKSGLMAVDIRGCIFKLIDSFRDGDSVGWNVEPRDVRWRGILDDGRAIEGCGTITQVPDRVLRPLRDTGEQDETLQWAGLPNKETA